MNATMRRIGELERYHEWHAAGAVLDRAIAWGVAVGKCTASQGRRIRTELVTMCPLEVYVAGRWKSQPATPEERAAGIALRAEFHAWERAVSRSSSFTTYHPRAR